MVNSVPVVVPARGRVSRPLAKTMYRRKPAESRALLRITRLSAGFVNEGFLALLLQ
jgi:hypothetical protein